MIDERFARSAMLYGESAQCALEKARVAVCGAGAVGSFAIEALARMGVGNFLIVDFDTVEKTNINRQLFALESTLGLAKIDVARARIADINGHANVQTIKTRIDISNVNSIFEFEPDLVLDAIDDSAAKVAVISACIQRAIPVFSSMGAARKRNPQMVEVADISKTSVCPLAAKIRKLLKEINIRHGLTCVYSRESVDNTSQKASADGVRKILGSTPVVTGTFGLMLANLAVNEIISKTESKI